MSGWITDRQPTYDNADSDNHDHVWVMEAGRGPLLAAVEDVEPGQAWHPKPASAAPDPYKPPVPDRIERWAVVSAGGTIVTERHFKNEAIRDAEIDGRVAHLVELREGDPTPEDVAAVIQTMKPFVARNLSANSSEIAGWLRILGGQP